MDNKLPITKENLYALRRIVQLHGTFEVMQKVIEIDRHFQKHKPKQVPILVEDLLRESERFKVD